MNASTIPLFYSHLKLVHIQYSLEKKTNRLVSCVNYFSISTFVI